MNLEDEADDLSSLCDVVAKSLENGLEQVSRCNVLSRDFRLKMKQLRNSYPLLWMQIFLDVVNDLKIVAGEKLTEKERRDIANNAAFYACEGHHLMMIEQKERT